MKVVKDYRCVRHSWKSSTSSVRYRNGGTVPSQFAFCSQIQFSKGVMTDYKTFKTTSAKRLIAVLLQHQKQNQNEQQAPNLCIAVFTHNATIVQTWSRSIRPAAWITLMLCMQISNGEPPRRLKFSKFFNIAAIQYYRKGKRHQKQVIQFSK